MEEGSLLHLLFGFRGRITRSKFWHAVAIYAVVVAVISILTYTAGLSVGLLFFIALAVYVPLIVSALAVGRKRLHDRDKSGWWLLVFVGLPVALGWLNIFLNFNTVLSYANLALVLWGLFELGLMRGSMGLNQYGPDPHTTA